MTSELNFESLLSQLGENSQYSEKGGFRFTELTMSDQRKILNMGFNPIEIPARISNIFNEYIKSAVNLTNDNGNIFDYVTVDIKPFIIVELRNLTLGNSYFDSTTDTTYQIRTVVDKDLEYRIKPTVIEFNKFILRISVPTIAKDQYVNSQILLELGNFKKKLTEEDYGKVADLYQVYELIKYITEIELDGNVFDFEKCPINKKIKIINSLPQRVISQISDYMDTVKEREELALTATNEEINSSITVDINSLFFTRTAKEKNK